MALKVIQRHQSSQQMVPEQSITCKGVNLDTDLTTVTKINPKWITGLNVKYETIKLLEDNIKENLYDLRYGDDFFWYNIKGQSMKEIIDKVDFLKITNPLCKRQCEKNEWQATDWQKTELILHIYSFCTLRFNQSWIFEKKKSPENFKKQNLNLPQVGNNVHNIYIVLTTIYTVFTLY